VRNPAMPPWRSTAAVSLAATGERDRAIALADDEVELARRWGTTRALGVALRAAGAARAGDEAIVQLREAAAVLAVSPGPLEHARALVDLGGALRRAGRRREARDRLGQGLEVAVQLGAAALAGRAREELIATK
jgi:hypothetical protein